MYGRLGVWMYEGLGGMVYVGLGMVVWGSGVGMYMVVVCGVSSVC